MVTFHLKKILLLITILCYWFHGPSQSHVYKNYTVEDGLPSSEVYSAFQDSKGYMWFATNAGVSRFNGYEFENFDSSDGLTDNSVYLITEDKKGRVWFGTLNCQLSYYENDSIYPYKYNNVLKDSLIGTHVLYSFNVDGEENVWMGFSHKGLKKVDRKGRFHCLSNQSGTEAKIDIIRENNNVYYGFSSNIDHYSPLNLIYYNKDNSSGKIDSYQLERNHILKFGTTDVICSNDTVIIQTNEDGFFYLNEKKNSLIKLNFSEYDKYKRLYSLYYENGLLYICSEKHGIYQCQINGDSLIVQRNLLKDISVSRMYKDSEGGYWFLTLENGVYYSPSLLITRVFEKSISERDRIRKMIADEEGNLFFLMQEKGILMQNRNKQKMQQLITPIQPHLLGFTYDPSFKRTLLSVRGDLFSYQNEILEPLRLKKKYEGREILSDSNKIYFANNFGFYAVENMKEIYPNADTNQEFVFHRGLIKYGGKIWIGTNKGIQVYHNQKITTPYSKNKYLSSSITSLDKLNEDLLLVGTKSYGLLIIKKDSVIDVINEEDGLVGNIIRKVHVDQQKNIWVGTNQGLSRINYQQNNQFQIYNITHKHGLTSSEIIDICTYKNNVFVATSKGVITFDQSQIKTNTYSPPVYFNYFLVNSKNRSIAKNLNLSYDENNINIGFEGLNYRSLGEVIYKYRMLGVDTNWTSTSTRFAQFPFLPSNDYTFEVKARNEDGVWSNTTSVSFTVNPPFWLTWWFIAAEIILGLIIIYFIFRYREKRLNYKNEMSKKVSEAEKKSLEQELTALRAQMNPHFIFNTLSAIQNAINTLDKSIASNYIARFGRLIRIVLESSKESTILVNTEFEMLSLYLDLEAVRFSNKFKHHIVKDEAFSDEPYYIPSMVIQPFVENAILHGLVPKKKENNLVLNISFELIDENTMVCIIEDNGIGREASAELNKTKNLNKTSMGMQITRERLDLYYQEKGDQYSFKITDLKDKDGEPQGTNVEITFTI